MSDADELTRHLHNLLHQLRLEYEAKAAPIIKQLVLIKSMEPVPPIYVTAEQAAKWLPKEIVKGACISEDDK